MRVLKEVCMHKTSITPLEYLRQEQEAYQRMVTIRDLERIHMLGDKKKKVGTHSCNVQSAAADPISKRAV